MPRKDYLSTFSLLFSLLISFCSLPRSANATKHLFHTKNDRRYVIAPIGEPFGFVKGGSISLTINDYQLLEAKSMTKKDQTSKGSGFFSSGKSKTHDSQETSGTSLFNGVFMLKRFETESEFRRFEESIIDDPSQCLYDKLRTHDRERELSESFDDDMGYNDFPSDIDEMPYYGHFDDYIEFNDDYFIVNTVDDTPIDDDWYSVEDLTDVDFTEDDYYAYLLTREDDAVDDQLGFDDANFDNSNKLSAQKPDVSHDGIFLSMENKALWRVPVGEKGAPVLRHTFTLEEEGLYVLMYQVCPVGTTSMFSQVRSTFKVKLQTQNVDALGRTSFLTAGEMHLPFIFFFLSLVYLVLAYFWYTILKGGVNGKDKVNVKAVHHLMTAILIMKTLSIFFESIRYHFISVNGHAEFWSFLYYSITFVKSISLFSVILLLGSGWSLIRPFLHKREKMIVLTVLILQILNNLAIIFILSDTEGENAYKNWLAFSHLVDIICCCLVLLPVVWQVSALEGQSETAETARTLKMLKLFRSFYLIVITWIYFTRVVVFLVSTVLPFKYAWLSSFLTEIGSIVFFIVSGYYFRPEPRTKVTLGTDDTNGINQEDAEYGDIEPLFVAGAVEIPGSKVSID